MEDSKRTNFITLAIVLAVLIEGLQVYLNMVYHPDDQPWLTIAITAVLMVAVGLGTPWRLKRWEKS